jgi:hypothetical protein
MRCIALVLALVNSPALAGPITGYTSYSPGSYAQVAGSENFTGTGSLVTLHTYMWVTSAWTEHVPRQPPGSGWDIIYHPGGTANAAIADTFQVIAGTGGTGWIEADLIAYSSCCGQFSLGLAGNQFSPIPLSSSGPGILQQFTAPVPLGQPFVIEMQLIDYVPQGGLHPRSSGFELKALRVYDASGQAVSAQLGVPEPATAWLTISGLLALCGLRASRATQRRNQM